MTELKPSGKTRDQGIKPLSCAISLGFIVIEGGVDSSLGRCGPERIGIFDRGFSFPRRGPLE